MLDADGRPVSVDGGPLRDGPVTPDGFVVNTAYSVNAPYPAAAAQSSLLPNQVMPTIGDRLSEKGLDWAWYAGGWNDALAGQADSGVLFQYHHHPFVYFASFADGTAAKAAHLKDETDFVAAAQRGTLPAVSFVKPAGVDNEHPNYTDVPMDITQGSPVPPSRCPSTCWRATTSTKRRAHNLQSDDAMGSTHAELEGYVRREGREYERRLLQGHLELRAARAAGGGAGVGRHRARLPARE